MADKYTPERIEALAEFARVWSAHVANPGSDEHPENAAFRLGITTPEGTLADWLRPEDWADRAAREHFETHSKFRVPPVSEAEIRDLAAIIRRHAEGRT